MGLLEPQHLLIVLATGIVLFATVWISLRAKPLGYKPYRWATWVGIIYAIAAASLTLYIVRMPQGPNSSFGANMAVIVVLVAPLAVTAIGILLRRRFGVVALFIVQILFVSVMILTILSNLLSKRPQPGSDPLSLAFGSLVFVLVPICTLIYFKRRWALMGSKDIGATLSDQDLAVRLESENRKARTIGLIVAGVFGVFLAIGFVIWMNFGQSYGPSKALAQVRSVSARNDEVDAATSEIPDAVRLAWAALGDKIKVPLPNGLDIQVPRLGVEKRFVDSLAFSGRRNDQTEFIFDRILFASGSPALHPESAEQLKNISVIMNAYPGVHILVGGYTDNSGSAVGNQTLSEERANNVVAVLTKFGVDPARMEAKGYGPMFPISSNDTEEGRAKNRRISFRVVAR